MDIVFLVGQVIGVLLALIVLWKVVKWGFIFLTTKLFGKSSK